jgi:predicted dehydrogenase
VNEKRIGIIMNGVTGRMGLNQHLVRSVLAIQKQGGVELSDGSRLVPDPILVGRNPVKLEQIAREHGVTRWTTDLPSALSDPNDAIYFDAQLTQLRAPSVEKCDCRRQARLL